MRLSQVPSKHVEDWKAYRAFVPAAPMKPGHVWNPTLPVQYIKVSPTSLLPISLSLTVVLVGKP